MTDYEIATNVMKHRISELLTRDTRLDGRGLRDYRDIKIEVGLIGSAAGSALVSLGHTKVIAGVKIEKGSPFPDKPKEGVLIVNAELAPLASPFFEPGPPNQQAIELARVVDRGIREAKTIDTTKLCINPGKEVFLIFVDVYVLNDDGNLFDASSIASIAALLNTKMKDYTIKKGELKYKTKYVKLPIKNQPIEVTIGRIDNKLLVDLSLEEEGSADAQITFAIDNADKICAIQKSKAGTFTFKEIIETFRIARIIEKKIRNILEGILNE